MNLRPYLTCPPPRQLLSDVIPFPRESDEGVVDKVLMGLRPEFPSNTLSAWFADALWEQIETCWDQDPKERPTVYEVLQALLALSETKHQEPIVSREDSDDEAAIGEWELFKDDTAEGASWAVARSSLSIPYFANGV